MSIPRAACDSTELDKRVVIVGLGNVGAALAPLIARLPLQRVTLIDYAAYKDNNLNGQSIDAGDVGKPKAEVQMRRLRRINPQLDVAAAHARVDDLPLGMLRADVVLAAVDSRATRRYLNRAAWRLGVPWIDAGVDAAGLLARVNVYVPGPDAPCLECSWLDADYAALEQTYPCQANGSGIPATNAPASLGAVTAGVMAIECQKLLFDDNCRDLLQGREVMFDLRHHHYYVTAFHRNPHCLFDHRAWPIERQSQPTPKTSLTAALRAALGDHDLASHAVGVTGQAFVAMLVCPECGHHITIPLRIASRVSARRRRCLSCGAALTTRGFDMRELLELGRLAPRDCRRSLSSFGIRCGDVLAVRTPGGQHYIEIGGEPRAQRKRVNGATVHAPALEKGDDHG